MSNESTIVSAVLAEAKRRFVLTKKSVHGIAHWQRVRENGLRIAKLTKADPFIIELFAFLHDCCRESEFSDPDHGARAAEFALTLHAGDNPVLTLDNDRFDILHEAIRDHTTGQHHKNTTIAICWDADRLDIGRVGKRPHPRFFSTKVAKTPEVIAWAYKRSRP